MHYPESPKVTVHQISQSSNGANSMLFKREYTIAKLLNSYKFVFLIESDPDLNDVIDASIVRRVVSKRMTKSGNTE